MNNGVRSAKYNAKYFIIKHTNTIVNRKAMIWQTPRFIFFS